MRTTLIISLCLLFAVCQGRQAPTLSAAVTNCNTAFPFSRFGGLFQAPFHAGGEFRYGFDWKTATRHDWFQQVSAGYFYHRFVQHGVPVYTNFGYRYKFRPHVYGEGSLGAGYLHSIPATAKLKLNSDGEYVNDKGIGRGQAMVVFNLGAGYDFRCGEKRTAGLFVNYQQRLQTPFIRSYVPLLPYNTLMVGCRIKLAAKAAAPEAPQQ